MDKNKIRYIIDYYSNLMTQDEKTAWRHWSSNHKMEHSDTMAYQIIRRRKMHIKLGWMTNDPGILRLLENGIEEFERLTAERIDREHQIQYNNCPKCKRLTRTPKAKQCRYCRHDWH